jgi:polar amino acid transport system ATP-binding protein
LQLSPKQWVTFENINIHDAKENLTKPRAKIGIIFHQFNIYPYMTAMENCLLVPMKVKKFLKKSHGNRKGFSEEGGLVRKSRRISVNQSVGLPEKTENCNK